ncbi:integrase [Mesorhizobium sp. M1403]|uniref:integrase n=1 Tax=Mesorhizobium sp. M1403 TaxID=2957097 RepID=UPI003337FCAA
MGHSQFQDASRQHAAWNAGKKVGTKRLFTQKQIWAIRFLLDHERRVGDRALFDLAIDSKLGGCDLVKIRIRDVVAGPEIRTRAIVVQQKTGRPVQFEITNDVRASILHWLERRGGSVEDYAFPSRVDHARHMSTIA